MHASVIQFLLFPFIFQDAKVLFNLPPYFYKDIYSIRKILYHCKNTFWLLSVEIKKLGCTLVAKRFLASFLAKERDKNLCEVHPKIWTLWTLILI